MKDNKYHLPKPSKSLLNLLNSGLSVGDEMTWKIVGGDGYLNPMIYDGIAYVSLGNWDNTLMWLEQCLLDIKKELKQMEKES